MKVEVIVLAGGKGTRFGKGIKKQYIKLEDKEILQHTLDKFDDIDIVNNIIVVCDNDDIEHIKTYNCKKIKTFTQPGTERMFSVNNALSVLDDDTDVVIVHDGVRPFFNKQKVYGLVDEAYKCGGSIFAVRSTDTIKKVVNNIVTETVDRTNLYNVQTPQAFTKDLLISSYQKAINNEIMCTDDSMVIEQCSDEKVAIIESDYENIKITTKIDLEIAKAILKISETNVW